MTAQIAGERQLEPAVRRGAVDRGDAITNLGNSAVALGAKPQIEDKDKVALITSAGSSALAGKLGHMEGVASADVVGDGVRVLAHGADGLLSEVVAAASPYGLRDMTITETSLETVFIQLTGRDLRE